jgi:hypothetical protein
MSPDYGFKPSYWNKEENKYEIDQDLIKKYSYDRERMLSMTISSSDIITITGLLIGNEKNQQIKKSLQMFKDYLKNESENIKLSKILRRYLRYEKFNERCLGFSIIIKEFFKKHQFENYIGRVYIKKI